MENVIKIGCPVCGTILTVQNQADIICKSVTCPVCNKRSPFVNFKRIADNAHDEPTQYPDPLTSDSENFTLGRLVVPGSDLSFKLQLGKNVIGRKAAGSSVQIQIPCTNKRMSREHLVIEIKRVPQKGFVHYASLNKRQVNPTYIGHVMLEYGDKIVLKHNDIIKLPDREVRFEIPDEEGTELYDK